jgi:hypothetical protein
MSGAPISVCVAGHREYRPNPGREVPDSLIIDISKAETDINVVLEEILALTKLNYNT